MNITSIFLALAMCTSMPADNYYSWFSPEIAETIMKDAVNSEYHKHLDYNGDGELSVIDAVSVLKRYTNNVNNGNELTLDAETIQAIIDENYSTDCIYWEIDFVDDQPCRKYELTVDKITTANIYLEFENITDNVKVEIDPFKEIVSVLN